MERQRASIGRLEMTFVVTCGAAVLAACGGAVDDDAPASDLLDDGSSPPACAKGTVCDPTPAPQTRCPSDIPQGGSYCNYEGPSCGYGFCLMTDAILQMAQCKDHRWVVSEPGSCPTPVPTETACPTEAPTSGSVCTYFGPDCPYSDFTSYCSYVGIPDQSAQCRNNQWTVSRAYCDPPWPDASMSEGDAGADATVDAADGGRD